MYRMVMLGQDSRVQDGQMHNGQGAGKSVKDGPV